LPAPFLLSGKKIWCLTSKYAKDACVYLWTIQPRQSEHLIHYIGATKTTPFAEKQREHLINVLGLNYGIWDARAAREGCSKMLWKGLWRLQDAEGSKDPGIIADKETGGENVLDIYRKNAEIMDYVSMLNIFAAPCKAELGKHIVGCIARDLRQKGDKSFYPDDLCPRPSNGFSGVAEITADEKISGLDSEIKL
jgi:hypothetical protein